MTPDVDIVIAGAGPGGLAAAHSAAQGGARVTVFEKNSEIGSPTRTSGGSFIGDLEKFGIPRELYHPVPVCRFVSPHRSARFEYARPVLCGMDVRRVYQFLAQRAITAGAEVRPATSVVDLLIEEKSVRGVRIKDARVRESEIASRIVIDATGHRAVLLKKAGVTSGHKRFGVGAEYDLFAPHYNDDEAVLLVGSMIAPCGYAWALPWGNHRVRFGVGVIHADTSANPEDYLNAFMQRAADFGIDLRGAQPVEYHTGLIPSDGMSARITGNGIMGVGDSAGQPSALLGEGIRWAIWAGQMAGETAAEAVLAKEYSGALLARYEKRWRSRFGTNLRIAAEINRRIARWTDDQWDSGTEILGRLTPDQFAKALRTELVDSWVAGAMWSNPDLLRAGAKVLFASFFC